MQNILYHQLENVLPQGMFIPQELKLLYEWIEDKGFYVDDENGKRIGLLCPVNEFAGTFIEFSHFEKDTCFWFDQDNDAEFMSRFCAFAYSPDGSIIGLWKSESSELKVVHIGSGSGSTVLCILADNMIGFLRLLAVGYSELGWEETFPNPPDKNDPDFNENILFQNWVMDTFKVDIPKTALEIIPHPAIMEDEASDDKFFTWCKQKFSFLG